MWNSGVYPIMNESFSQMWHTPIFSNLLSDRRECMFIAGAGGLHLGLSLVGLPGWTCPILSATGIPCPGCGLTRATLELVRGDFVGSFQTHAFAPVFLFAMILILLAIALPEVQRNNLIARISIFETRNGATAWGLLCLMLYWAVRLVA